MQSSRFRQEDCVVTGDDGSPTAGKLAAHNPLYYTHEEIESSPTYRAGETKEQVNKFRKTYTNMILAVCEKMRV
jgi:hypothetical protein